MRSKDKISYPRLLIPLIRWDSLMKLSTFLSFCIADFVHPSSLTTASISSRSGTRYSGLAATWYNACVKLWESFVREWHDVKGFHGPTIDEECMATKLKNRMYGMTWVMSFPLSSIVSMTHCNMSSYQSNSVKFIASHIIAWLTGFADQSAPYVCILFKRSWITGPRSFSPVFSPCFESIM